MLLLVALLVTVSAAYLYGRLTCPPPPWWVRLFVASGDYGCVA